MELTEYVLYAIMSAGTKEVSFRYFAKSMHDVIEKFNKDHNIYPNGALYPRITRITAS